MIAECLPLAANQFTYSELSGGLDRDPGSGRGGSVVTLLWAVYDSGDGILDSTTIIDNFRWLSEETDGPTPHLCRSE